MSTPMAVLRFIGRNSKRVAVSVVGMAVVLVGLALLVLPGPGMVVVVLGFAILGTQYAWAERALHHTKKVAGAAGRQTKRGVRSVRRRVKYSPGQRGEQ
jgi:uncharacterized protein (TIGR02611 family)